MYTAPLLLAARNCSSLKRLLDFGEEVGSKEEVVRMVVEAGGVDEAVELAQAHANIALHAVEGWEGEQVRESSHPPDTHLPILWHMASPGAPSSSSLTWTYLVSSSPSLSSNDPDLESTQTHQTINTHVPTLWHISLSPLSPCLANIVPKPQPTPPRNNSKKILQAYISWKRFCT